MPCFLQQVAGEDLQSSLCGSAVPGTPLILGVGGPGKVADVVCVASNALGRCSKEAGMREVL